MNTYCGADCEVCQMKDSCGGCAKTEGRPFGGACLLAECAKKAKGTSCGTCEKICTLKAKLIEEINALSVSGLPKVTELFALPGFFVNMEFVLSDGRSVKLLDDRKIYLGTQIEQGSGRCIGIAADSDVILVCEYGDNGSNPEIVLFCRREK